MGRFPPYYGAEAGQTALGSFDTRSGVLVALEIVEALARAASAVRVPVV